MNAIIERLRRPSTIVVAGIVVAIVVLFYALDIEQALLIGVIGGAAYGLLALGLVLIYKSSGVFNFAQAEFGTVAVFTLFLLRDRMPYPLAIVGALAAAVAMGLALEVLVIRPLADAPRVTLLVATAAAALLAVGLELWLGGATLRSIQPLFHSRAFTALGQNISWQQVSVVIALGVLGVLLALFFNRTNLGLAVLGASQQPYAAQVVGISVRRLSLFTWGLAALLGGIAGVLYVPIIGTFGPGALTAVPGSAILIPSVTAAVIGGMTSLPGAFVGCMIVGIAQAAAVSYEGFDSIPGAGSAVTFVLLLAVLIARPQGLLGSRT
jgi:branched-chain amino acid transport system permease protein